MHHDLSDAEYIGRCLLEVARLEAKVKRQVPRNPRLVWAEQGMHIFESRVVPGDEIWFVDNGRIAGRMTNVG